LIVSTATCAELCCNLRKVKIDSSKFTKNWTFQGEVKYVGFNKHRYTEVENYLNGSERVKKLLSEHEENIHKVNKCITYVQKYMSGDKIITSEDELLKAISHVIEPTSENCHICDYFQKKPNATVCIVDDERSLTKGEKIVFFRGHEEKPDVSSYIQNYHILEHLGEDHCRHSHVRIMPKALVRSPHFASPVPGILSDYTKRTVKAVAMLVNASKQGNSLPRDPAYIGYDNEAVRLVMNLLPYYVTPSMYPRMMGFFTLANIMIGTGSSLKCLEDKVTEGETKNHFRLWKTLYTTLKANKFLYQYYMNDFCLLQAASLKENGILTMYTLVNVDWDVYADFYRHKLYDYTLLGFDYACPESLRDIITSIRVADYDFTFVKPTKYEFNYAKYYEKAYHRCCQVSIFPQAMKKKDAKMTFDIEPAVSIFEEIKPKDPVLLVEEENITIPSSTKRLISMELSEEDSFDDEVTEEIVYIKEKVPEPIVKKIIKPKKQKPKKKFTRKNPPKQGYRKRKYYIPK
jgi:hypothetical protein